MTYDITFIPKSAGQTWTDALRARESRVGRNSAEDGADERMRPIFERIVADVLAAEPTFERVDGPGFVELTEPASGMQLHLFANEISLAVPFAHAGRAAEEIAARLPTIVQIVERETGYRGYDPQLGEAFLDAEDAVGHAAREMSRVARMTEEKTHPVAGDEHRSWWRRRWSRGKA